MTRIGMEAALISAMWGGLLEMGDNNRPLPTQDPEAVDAALRRAAEKRARKNAKRAANQEDGR